MEFSLRQKKPLAMKIKKERKEKGGKKLEKRQTAITETTESQSKPHLATRNL